MSAVKTLSMAALLLILGVPAARAQSLCGTVSHEMSWPTVNPVWRLCWRRAVDSTGPNGSGLEIHEVFYKGKKVLRRAHAPILNVQYDPGGCGGSNLCYRDWADQEARFQSDNEIFPGYSEPTTPPVTVCDTGTGVDVGSFYGVAAEKGASTLILTTQYRAGWYRYTMKWFFDLDGTIRTTMGFSAVADSCVSYSHNHHNYWRLDFDIDGPGGDAAFDVVTGQTPVSFTTEVVRNRGGLGQHWEVKDKVTGRGYKIFAGGKEIPADAFSVADAWILAYRSSELDDSGQPGPACAIKIGNFVNGENIDGKDLVFWYGAHARHLANQLDDCQIVGPTLRPIGNW